MISIIVCSTNEKWRENLRINIEKTINSDFEFLYIDNSQSKKGICEIYNQLAQQAKGDFLCFCHEDVEFETYDWGNIIVDFCKNPTVGVIGFAGTKNMTRFPYWANKYAYESYLIQGDKNMNIIYDHTLNNENNKSFSKVITLDGLCLFCRKDVWDKTKFDEKNFSEFHYYDIDFSFSASLYFNNFVCRTIKVTHFSMGNFNKNYFDSMIIFYYKWKNYLPKQQNTKQLHSCIRKTFKFMIKKNLTLNEVTYYMKKLNLTRSPLSFLFVVEQYIKYSLKKYSHYFLPKSAGISPHFPVSHFNILFL